MLARAQAGNGLGSVQKYRGCDVYRIWVCLGERSVQRCPGGHTKPLGLFQIARDDPG